MTGIGLKAAPLLSKMRAGGWRSSSGPSWQWNLSSSRGKCRVSLRATWLLEGVMTLGMDTKGRAGSVTVPGNESVKSTAAPAGRSLKVLIVTDAWSPQVNGVVRTLEVLGRELTARGHRVRYATAENHTTLPLPTYPEIRLALFPRQTILDA